MGPSHPTISSNIHAIQLVSSFVVLRIDYCDSLYVGLQAGQLDRIQSAAQCGNLRTEKVWPHYAVPEGHCLPVPQRVKNKCCLLMYKTFNGLAPSYIFSYCTSIAEVQRRLTLRSATHGNLTVPRSKTSSGQRPLFFSGWSIGMKFASRQCQNCHISRHFQETS